VGGKTEQEVPVDHRPRRFGSAHALALLALFFALAGSAYAVKQAAKNSVNTNSVKNGSLTGKDVKDNSLTGKDVKESSLGQVPNAGSAQSAQSAATAQSFAGVKKIDYQDNQTGQSQTILDFRGLSLTAKCQSLGSATGLALDAHTTPAATVNSSMVYANGPNGGVDGAARLSETPVMRGGALGAGGAMAIIPVPPAPVDAFGDGGSGAGQFAQAEGQIVYRTDSDVVTVTLHTFMDFRGAGTGFCEAYGNALAQ
jgi:hypothetical protein